MDRLQELMAKLKATRKEWEGKAMPKEVADQFAADLKEANALKEQAEQMQQLDSLVAFDEEGTGRKTDPVAAPESKQTQPAQAKSKDPVFRTLGEQLKAIQLKESGHAKSINMLAEVEARAKAAGLNEAVDSEGGSLIQEEFSKEIMENSVSTGEILSRIDLKPVTGNTMKTMGVDETSRADGFLFGGMQAYWASEGAPLTSSKPKYYWVKNELNKLHVLCYATDELLDDAAHLGADMMEKMPIAIKYKAEGDVVEGPGNGRPLGFMNQTAALVSIAKESGQAADSIVVANLAKMRARMPVDLRAGAVWLYNPDVEDQLLTLTLGNFPVFMPPSGISGRPYNTIWAAPAIPCEHMQTLGDKGDIAYVNLHEIKGIDKSLKAAQSMHVRFLYDEMAFRVTYRFDAQPKWKQSVTPKHGSNKVSPYVTLAERA